MDFSPKKNHLMIGLYKDADFILCELGTILHVT